MQTAFIVKLFSRNRTAAADDICLLAYYAKLGHPRTAWEGQGDMKLVSQAESHLTHRDTRIISRTNSNTPLNLLPASSQRLGVSVFGSCANQPTSSVLLRSYSSRYLERTLSSFPEPWDTITLRVSLGSSLRVLGDSLRTESGWLKVQTGCVAP